MPCIDISVAMCTFNGARFVAAQLQSIAAQNRLPDELVICDDGSSDGTAEIIREFAERTEFPTRVVVNDCNLGSTKNFEKAIGLCQSAIVALADQDDVWYRNKLERIEQAFRGSTATVAVFSDADIIDDSSKVVGERLWSRLSFDRLKQRAFATGHGIDVLIKHPVVTGATMAFWRNLFSLLAPIPVNDVHDRWISELLALRGSFATIAEPLMQYRQHAGQQLGLGPSALRAQLALAKTRGADVYMQDIERYRALYQRIEDHLADFPQAEEAKKKIQQKLIHLEHRARLASSPMERVPRVLWETMNGNYWRYSGGWKSVAKDMLLR